MSVFKNVANAKSKFKSREKQKYAYCEICDESLR